jgi:hypothetical protein
MPQIFMWLSPGTQALFTDDDMEKLGKKIMPLIRQAFLFAGGDTTFSAKRLDAAINVADIQIIIRYMPCRDADDKSLIDPIRDRREDLAEQIGKEFQDFIAEDGLPDSATLSVLFELIFGGYCKNFTAKKDKK